MKKCGSLALAVAIDYRVFTVRWFCGLELLRRLLDAQFNPAKTLRELIADRDVLRASLLLTFVAGLFL